MKQSNTATRLNLWDRYGEVLSLGFLIGLLYEPTSGLSHAVVALCVIIGVALVPVRSRRGRLFRYGARIGVVAVGNVLLSTLGGGMAYAQTDPDLVLRAYPDRFPLVNSDNLSRRILVESRSGVSLDGVTATLYVDGTAMAAKFDLDDQSLTTVSYSTVQTHKYQIEATIGGITYRGNVLRVEWRVTPPLADTDSYLEGLEGGSEFAAFLVPVVLGLVLAVATKNALIAGGGFYGSFAVMVYLTEVNTLMFLLMFLLVFLVGLGITLGAFALGYKG